MFLTKPEIIQSGTLTDRPELEVPAPPYLCCSFLGGVLWRKTIWSGAGYKGAAEGASFLPLHIFTIFKLQVMYLFSY